MQKEQVLQIQEDEFTVDTESEFLFNLIDGAIKKAGGTGNLSKVLVKERGLNRYSERRLVDNLRKWQKQKTKRQIPLDVFLSISDFCDVNPGIKGIRFKGSRSNLKTDYPLYLNKAWAFVSECVKVEGHLTRKRIVLENTNTEVTTKLKKELLKIGIKKEKIREVLHIKIQIPENIKKQDIRILNLSKNKEIKNFHERVLNLKLGKKKEVVFTENNFSYNEDLVYRIIYKNKFFDVKTKIFVNNKILVESDFNDSRYHKATISLRLDVWNKTLVYLLHEYFKIPYGKKSGILEIPSYLKYSQKNILKEIINATLATESTICPKFIAICSLSLKYLKDFQEILLKFNITSKIDKKYFTLRVSGYRNFSKISKYFDFIIKEKNRQFKLLLSRRFDKAPHGSAIIRYLKVLENLKEATMIEILNKTNRTGNSFRIYIGELLNKGYIKPITRLRPKKYALTKEGQIFLKAKETYWLD